MVLKRITWSASSGIRKLIFGFFIGLTAFCFLFINLKMPFAGEDYTMTPWRYHAMPITLSEQIRALWNKLYSSAIMWNPRIGEALTSITAAFPKIVFDVLNTIFFVWLIFILFFLSFGRFPSWKKTSDLFSLVSIVLLLFWLFPLFGQVFVWKAGTLNHTWGLVFLLSFLLPFRANHFHRIRFKNIILLILYTILGLLAGLSVENAALIVFVFIVIYFAVLLKKKRIDSNFIYPILSFGIGLGFLIFSSGTTVRRNFYSSLEIQNNLSGLSLYTHRLSIILSDFFKTSWPLLLVFLSTFVAYYLILRFSRPQPVACEESIPTENFTIPNIFVLFLVGLSSVLVFVVVAYQGDQRRGFEIFWLVLISLSVFLMTEIWNHFHLSLFHIGVVLAFSGMLLYQMVEMGIVYTQFSYENNQRMEIIEAAIQNGEKAIVLPAITVKDSRIVETREMLSDNLADRLADYFGFESVTIER